MLNKNTDHRLGYLLTGFVVLVLLLSAALPALASVGLIYFEARPGTNVGQVIVGWGTESETDTVGFRVRRSTQPFVQTATVVIAVPSQGSATTGASYEITDDGLIPSQTYYYWLAELTSSGGEYLVTQGVQVVAPGFPPAHQYFLPVMHHSF